MTFRSLTTGTRGRMVSILLLLLSAVLTYSHATVVASLSSTVLPLSRAVPPLEQRLEVLSEQVELTLRQQLLRTAAPAERIRTYVLPTELDLDRVIATFETLERALRARGDLRSMSQIELLPSEDAASPVPGLRAHPMTLSMTLRRQGLEAVQGLIDLAGMLTVADTFTAEQRSRLLQASEAENPANIVALEQFMRLDLLTYATDRTAHDERLRRAFTSPEFLAVFDGVLHASSLEAHVLFLRSTVGASLAHRGLWPLPSLGLSSMTIANPEGEWMTVEMEVLVFTRD